MRLQAHPLGLPIYVAPLPAGSIPSVLHSSADERSWGLRDPGCVRRPGTAGGAYSLKKNMADENKSEENPPPLEQVEFDINEADSEVAHTAIRESVKDLNGVREVQFVGGGAVVTFNPIGITKEEICTAIRRSGYRATEITSSPGNA